MSGLVDLQKENNKTPFQRLPRQELNFMIWQEQRRAIIKKPEKQWTKKDYDFMNLGFDEFLTKVLYPFEDFLDKRMMPTKKQCSNCGRAMPHYRTSIKIKTSLCRHCNAERMGKANGKRRFQHE
jgi:ribosomal protein S14